MSRLDTKARMLRVITFSDADLGVLETAVQTWLEAQTEAVVQQINYDATGAEYSIVIFYTEA